MSHKTSLSHLQLVHSAPAGQREDARSTISLSAFHEGRLAYDVLDHSQQEPVAQVLSFEREIDTDHSLHMLQSGRHAAMLFRPLSALVDRYGETQDEAKNSRLLCAESNESLLGHPLTVSGLLCDGVVRIAIHTINLSKTHAVGATFGSNDWGARSLSIGAWPVQQNIDIRPERSELPPRGVRPLIVGALAVAYNCLLGAHNDEDAPVVALSVVQRIGILSYLDLPVQFPS